MFDALLRYYITTMCVALILFAVWRHTAWRHTRRQERCAVQRRACILRIAEAVATEMPSPSHAEQIGAFSPYMVAESLAYVADALGSEATERIAQIADRYAAHEVLLSHARRQRGYRRAIPLALISKLPPSDTVAERVRLFAEDGNRFVRFYSLMAHLAADHTVAMQRLADLPYRLSHFETAEMMTLLQHGNCPVAYTPLLKSGNGNLAMFGMQIVRQFDISDSETMLYDILRHGDHAQRLDAIFLIASMGGCLTSTATRGYIRTLPAPLRRSLYRHIALKGYTAEALRPLFHRGERAYIESILKSYKRTIA